MREGFAHSAIIVTSENVSRRFVELPTQSVIKRVKSGVRNQQLIKRWGVSRTAKWIAR